MHLNRLGARRTASLLLAVLVPLTALGQAESAVRKYIVRPHTWNNVSVAVAQSEFNADSAKPEFLQRWLKLSIQDDSEVFISTAVHGIARIRLTTAILSRAEWVYDKESLRATVPDDIANALATSDSISESIRKSFGPGLPVILEAGLGFTFNGQTHEGHMSLPTKPRPNDSPLALKFTPPSEDELKSRLPGKPSFGPGYEIVPDVFDGTYDSLDEYAKIAEFVADFAKRERKKAEETARGLLPTIIGSLGHELLAMDLNNAEFDKLPNHIKDQLESAIELQPQKYGYSSLEQFHRERDAGLRLKLAPDIRIMLPFKLEPSGATATYAIPIKLTP